MNQSRLLYIDNLRIFLISLVVLLHLNITYGAPGDWYYNESKVGIPEILPMSMFNATNQSFFMGLFFFISAFFIVPSLKRKGVLKFVADRFVRLGIPLLLFYFLLNPLTFFIRNYFINHEEPTFTDYIMNGWARGVGPLWFVLALLIFTFIYLVVRSLKFSIRLQFPGTITILFFAMFTGLLQFVIRIWFPVGWSMPFTNFQLSFFMQYIFLFPLGIVAYNNHWLDIISFKTGEKWFLFAQVMIFLGFPLLFILGGAAESGPDNFMGGMKLQSLAYALWEQLTGVSLMIGLIGLFKHFLNNQGNFAKKLSENAYGVFVFHAPLIVGLGAAFSGWHIFPLLKFILLAPLALIICFLTSWLIKQLPLCKRIF